MQQSGQLLSLPIAFPFPPEKLSALQAEALEWAFSHGLVMYSKNTNQLTHAPFTLVPSPFPRQSFEFAWNLGPDFNYLVDQISRDTDFLFKSLER
jgi:glutathione synthase